MQKIIIICLSLSIFLVSCSQIRESAGVNRKNIDEFNVIENPPLVIPPDYNLLPPEQLAEKNIDNVESDLAKEILFGLNNDSDDDNLVVSTMENILNQTKADQVSQSIRQEINEQFSSEKKLNSIDWKNDSEILDSIAESEKLRNANLGIESKTSKKAPALKEKKKKRFFFF